MIYIEKGNIAKIEVDAIVNSAKESLLGGVNSGGVDGAIHRSAGPRLFEACRKLGVVKIGKAKISLGYNLPAIFVIHTPGPVYKDGRSGEAALLASCYRESLKCADENKVESIAFPAIATGFRGYPKEEAAEIAVKTVLRYLNKSNFIEDAFFVVASYKDYKIYSYTLRKVCK